MLKTTDLTYKPLIEKISLTFSSGLFAILGPNGAGKSTFLKTLCGVWPSQSGTVTWNDRNLLVLPRREISKIISLVPQNPQIPFAFSVWDFVTMGRYPHETLHKKTKEKQIIEWALTTVAAWPLRNRKMTQLSAGERQRIYIARALATESPILLLDEPTANLDIRHQAEIWSLLHTLKSQERIVIVATHDLSAVCRHFDRAALFQEGRCLATGTVSETVTEENLTKLFGQGSEAFLTSSTVLI